MSAVLNSDPDFRDMQEEDLDDVMVLEEQGHPFPWTLGIFRDCLRVGYVCRVMVQEGQLLAYGVMSVAAGEAHVFNVCVDETRRSRGLGRGMMEDMIEAAQDRDAKSVFLEVRPSNKPALHLYEKMGFNEVGVRKAYYPAKDGREDALILAKDL